MLFGHKIPEGSTHLILDVENSSVGAGLVRSHPDHAPKLFGETRVYLPVLQTRDSHALMQEIRGALNGALRHVADVAGRLRTHEVHRALGEISKAHIHFAAPWGRPDLSSGTPHFEEPLVVLVAKEIERTLGDVPHTVVSGAGAVTAATRSLLPYEDNYLLCFVSGEVTELVLVHEGAVAGYATMPLGRHIGVRTLRTHAGLTLPEARSALRMNALHVSEPLRAAAEHFAEQLAETISPLLKVGKVGSVYIVAVEHGEWLARSLAQSQIIAELFPRGGTVRALRQEHVTPYLSAHAPAPDLLLMLESLVSR